LSRISEPSSGPEQGITANALDKHVFLTTCEVGKRRMTMRLRLTSTCVLVLCVLAFAVPAYAGNGSGNGNGNGTGDTAPGNSASAPGQVKKEEAAYPAETTTTTSSTTTVTESSAPASEGVKPSNETAHEMHAQAQSDETKLYGNGHTAGEIATDHGAPGNTVLHGPGNSQPHKAAPCSGGHERDVHALKVRHAGSCGGDPPGQQPGPGPTPDLPGHHDDAPPTVTTEDKKPSSSDPAPSPQASAGGEAGGELASSSNGEGDALAATERFGPVASLPFTGQELWLAVLVGLVLIGTGLGLRQIRTAEAAVGSGHDHTDSARYPARGSRPPVGGRSSR
jgi:hypothetical protein